MFDPSTLPLWAKGLAVLLLVSPLIVMGIRSSLSLNKAVADRQDSRQRMVEATNTYAETLIKHGRNPLEDPVYLNAVRRLES